MQLVCICRVMVWCVQCHAMQWKNSVKCQVPFFVEWLLTGSFFSPNTTNWQKPLDVDLTAVMAGTRMAAQSMKSKNTSGELSPGTHAECIFSTNNLCMSACMLRQAGCACFRHDPHSESFPCRSKQLNQHRTAVTVILLQQIMLRVKRWEPLCFAAVAA